MLPRTARIVFWALLVGGCAHKLPAPQPISRVALQPGDMLFQDLDGSPLADAIETVTDGVEGSRFSHVGMVIAVDGDEPQVIEAGGRGVVITPVGRFLARSLDGDGRPKVLVGRLEESHRRLIPAAIEYAKGQVGKPYDKPYVMREDAFYCSELLYYSFAHANAGEPVFDTAPMTFKDPSTGEFFPAWIEYYRKLGTTIPEGEPGLNPGGMSRASCVKIVAAYGEPSRK